MKSTDEKWQLYKHIRNIDARLYLASIVVGVSTALINIPYHALINKSYSLRSQFVSETHAWLIYPMLFAAAFSLLLIIMYMVRRYPILSGGGVPQARAVLNGRITFKHNLRNLVFKFFGGISTLGMGFSLGREGPSIHFGSYVGDFVAKTLNVRIGLRKHLVAAGVGAGLASAFSAPLAGAIIVIESVERFDAPKTAITSFLAACIAGYLSTAVFAQNVFEKIIVVHPDLNILSSFLLYAGIAAAIAIYAKIFSYLLIKGKQVYPKIKIPWQLKILILLGIAFTASFLFIEIAGGGEHFLESEVMGLNTKVPILIALMVSHMLFTVISFAPGFPGGIFIPLMVSGGIFGKLLGMACLQMGIVQPENISYFMLIGMSALLVAVYRTPITAIVLITEISRHLETFMPSVIVGGLTFYFSELLRIRPIDQILYNQMIKIPEFRKEKRVLIYLEVMRDSYFDGKEQCQLQLPSGCIVKRIRRDYKEIALQGAVLQIGDQVEIEINQEDIETLYEPLTSMANTP